MSSTARLVIQLCKKTENISVMRLGSQESIYVSTIEEGALQKDCSNFDVEKFEEGFAIQANMTPENWGLWTDAYSHTSDSENVWLTVCKDGICEDCVSGVTLAECDEVVAPPNEKALFLKDLIGFDEARFNASYSVPCRMSSENWELWHFRYGAEPFGFEKVA